ncbi:glycoside hydrolase family 5 protein [Arenibacter sp. 6A1]|uniref:cellulase family glycosylhydrolase n=1 Tax=Arenibacter sp. 6A1 TaxID=2720391 RepID=UPI001447894C|nr:cellulase family glycosylhydrolase [Arenibacter sp. 6A1]NKI26990.1 glycoside hydrolase family 5 protein [Arenibacter sp. 6A1]
MRVKVKKVCKALFLMGFTVVISGCNHKEASKANEMIFPKGITVAENRFVDDLGRQVILSGINVVSKNKKENYLFRGGPEFYRDLKKWGFNSIRFIMIWDGLEPEPGVYNEAYLQEIDKRIQWAGDNGLFVILDMHQDLFSVKYADGAPEWATLDEGKSHITGDVWSDAYMMSPAVQTAFDNFWANKEVPNGVGLQDHYANLWQHIAKRYADNPTVIGYDVMNEPFPGSAALEATPILLKAYGELLYSISGQQRTEEELMLIWGDVNQRTEALKHIASQENFAKVIDALFPLTQTFESEFLQPFYQKVSNAIREVDSRSILFLEHSYFGNMGVRSSIERTKLPNGEYDPLVAYAPHGYDLVTDTEKASEASSERVNFIYNRIKEKGNALGMPVWMGEWGAFYDHGEGIVSVAQHAMDQIETHNYGNAYWSYDPGMEHQSYFKQVIIRPYPAYINGELVGYGNNFEKNILQVRWREDKNNKAPTIIYIPKLSSLDQENIDGSFNHKINRISKSDACWLIIPAIGQNEDRELTVSFNRS